MEKFERNDSKKFFYIMLKEEATKRLPLIIWGHSLGDYLYVLVTNGLTLRHKIYSITQENDNYLERKTSS